MFKNILLLYFEISTQKLDSKAILEISVPFLLHLESDYSFMKTSQKALCKSHFPFLFKCENILNLFVIHSHHKLL